MNADQANESSRPKYSLTKETQGPDWRMLRGSRHESVLLALVLFLFASLATIYSITTPVLEGFDENWHYAFVQYIANGKGLPQQPPEQFPHLARQEASQPPLYYLLAAAITFWIPDNDTKIYDRYNPQFVPVPWDYLDNKNIIIHTNAEDFPWQGSVLAIHLARFLSILLGTLTIYITYVLARSLFPDDQMLAYGAMILAALTPSFIFTSAIVSNDVLIAFLSSLVLVLLVRLIRVKPGPDRGNLRQQIKWAAILSVACGLAALTKLSGLGLYLLVGVVLSFVAWQTKDFRGLFISFALLVCSFMLLAGWWYMRNWMLYGDVTGLNAMLEIMGRREPGFGLGDLLPELEGIRRSYWEVFGQTNIVLNDWFYYAFDLLTLVSRVGLLVFIYRAWQARRRRELGWLALLALWFAIVATSLTRWALMTTGSQGRLLYPAIGAISILLVRGWIEIVPRRVSALVVVALIGVAVYVPFFAIPSAYAQPVQLSQERIDNFVSTRTAVHFGPVSLLGYRVEQRNVEPGALLWIDGCWSTDEKIAEDYIVFIQLLTENDLIAAQKDTYHGLGTFPTSKWRPGTMFCDRYPLRLRDTSPARSTSQVAIGLYRASGERLQVQSDGKSSGDNFRFAGPAITDTSGRAHFDYRWGKDIALVDYRLDKTAMGAGEHLAVSLTWQSLSTANYVATVQIMDPKGRIIGQSDQPLKVPSDEREILISPYAEPEVYEIKVGVYQPAPLENLPLYHDGRRQQGSDLLSLWSIRVLP
jgi:4-amino-4-deoxy-L-arabinose transferase-like glycosyltransferase